MARQGRGVSHSVDRHRRAEPPCYLRDPDGYLIEVGQATGLLEGIYAEAQIEEREAAAGVVLLWCACHRLPLRA